jgi:hypothetical protein
MPYHYDEDKKKKRRVVETDPAKKAWKALQSGGLDPMPFDDGFDVYEAKKHLKEEVKGMGPEGKRFLKDKLSGKKYEGKLKPKFKKDLLKELEGMSSKGKSFVKKELGDPRQSYEDYLDRKIGDLADRKRKGAFGVEKPDNKKKDKPMEFKGPDFLKPAGWDDMSEKNKASRAKMMVGAMSDIGQAIGKGMSDKDMKSYVKKEKGDSMPDKWGTQKDLDPEVKKHYDRLKFDKDEMTKPNVPIYYGEAQKGKGQKQQEAEFKSDVQKRYAKLKKKYPLSKLKGGKLFGRSLEHIAKNKAFFDMVEKKESKRPALERFKIADEHRAEQDYVEQKRQKHSEDVYKRAVEKSKKAVADKKMSKLLEKEDLDRRKKAVKKEKGDSKNWIQDAVKKPGALRETAKRMGLIKGDELLSSKDLDELKSKAKKSNNALLMRRVNLAKTFKKMKK